MSPSALHLVTVVSALLDGALLLAVLLDGRVSDSVGGRRIGLPRVLLAAVALGALQAVKLPLLALAGVDFFGFVRLAYADLAVCLPIVGASLFVHAWRGRLRLTVPAGVLTATAILGAPLGAYASFVEPFRLQLERATVHLAPERAGAAPIRIGVFADLQTGRITDYEREAARRLVEAGPDVILIPGDVFQGTAEDWQREWNALRGVLGSLRAPHGVFAVEGDMETLALLREVCDGTGVQVLHQETVDLTIGDRTLRIAGVGTDESRRDALAYAAVFRDAPGDADVRVLFGHHPDIALGLDPQGRIDLVVAGHTHGGQIVLPGFGPPITLSGVPRAVGAGGLHVLDGVPIYVSRGIGCERGQAPQVRFLCPPEITLLELR